MRSRGGERKQSEESMNKEEKAQKCSLCGKPSTRLVDGEPSCEEHAELVYENQIEDYTKKHIDQNDWLEN